MLLRPRSLSYAHMTRTSNIRPKVRFRPSQLIADVAGAYVSKVGLNLLCCEKIPNKRIVGSLEGAAETPLIVASSLVGSRQARRVQSTITQIKACKYSDRSKASGGCRHKCYGMSVRCVCECTLAANSGLDLQHHRSLGIGAMRKISINCLAMYFILVPKMGRLPWFSAYGERQGSCR